MCIIIFPIISQLQSIVSNALDQYNPSPFTSLSSWRMICSGKQYTNISASPLLTVHEMGLKEGSLLLFTFKFIPKSPDSGSVIAAPSPVKRQLHENADLVATIFAFIDIQSLRSTCTSVSRFWNSIVESSTAKRADRYIFLGNAVLDLLTLQTSPISPLDTRPYAQVLRFSVFQSSGYAAVITSAPPPRRDAEGDAVPKVVEREAKPPDSEDVSSKASSSSSSSNRDREGASDFRQKREATRLPLPSSFYSETPPLSSMSSASSSFSSMAQELDQLGQKMASHAHGFYAHSSSISPHHYSPLQLHLVDLTSSVCWSRPIPLISHSSDQFELETEASISQFMRFSSSRDNYVSPPRAALDIICNQKHGIIYIHLHNGCVVSFLGRNGEEAAVFLPPVPPLTADMLLQQQQRRAPPPLLPYGPMRMMGGAGNAEQVLMVAQRTKLYFLHPITLELLTSIRLSEALLLEPPTPHQVQAHQMQNMVVGDADGEFDGDDGDEQMGDLLAPAPNAEALMSPVRRIHSIFSTASSVSSPIASSSAPLSSASSSSSSSSSDRRSSLIGSKEKRETYCCTLELADGSFITVDLQSLSFRQLSLSPSAQAHPNQWQMYHSALVSSRQRRDIIELLDVDEYQSAAGPAFHTARARSRSLLSYHDPNSSIVLIGDVLCYSLVDLKQIDFIMRVLRPPPYGGRILSVFEEDNNISGFIRIHTSPAKLDMISVIQQAHWSWNVKTYIPKLDKNPDWTLEIEGLVPHRVDRSTGPSASPEWLKISHSKVIVAYPRRRLITPQDVEKYSASVLKQREREAAVAAGAPDAAPPPPQMPGFEAEDMGGAWRAPVSTTGEIDWSTYKDADSDQSVAVACAQITTQSMLWTTAVKFDAIVQETALYQCGSICLIFARLAGARNAVQCIRLTTGEVVDMQRELASPSSSESGSALSSSSKGKAAMHVSVQSLRVEIPWIRGIIECIVEKDAVRLAESQSLSVEMPASDAVNESECNSML